MSLKRAPLLAGLCVAAAALGCMDLEGALVPADSCAALEEDLRAQAIEEMERLLDENLEQALIWAAAPSDPPSTGTGDGARLLIDPQPICFYRDLDSTNYLAGVPITMVETSNEAPTAASGTNNQVVGVDEADFVKNDGSYIYIVADGAFQILDAWPPEEAQRIASLPIEGLPKRLFVSGDRALVYSSPERSHYIPCTYGYDCEFTGDGADLDMTIVDISDRSSPEIVRETHFSGSYLNARRIGDIAHTVVSFATRPVSYPEWPEGVFSPYLWYGGCGLEPTYEERLEEQELRSRFAELEESNRALLEAYDFLADLPGMEDTRYTAQGEVTEHDLFVGCDNFYLSDSRDGRGLLSLVSVDMSELDSLDAVNIVSRPGAVYSSARALYVATRHYRHSMSGWYPSLPPLQDEATSVHKFALEPGSTETEYRASGLVKGRVLNQFAMDEYEGHLRIATTTGHAPSPLTHSTLSVLREEDGRLEVVGIVDDLAPTEDIRSVRFDGDTGFMVTFKKTDPLFAFDLGDPENPEVRGELKIPGFSTYMHLLDEDHLLTIGYDADDQGSFAWFQGIQLQIMDISDLDAPQLIHKEIIGSRGTSSEAATDHLAFNYFAERGLLAIPMTLCDDSQGGGSYASELSFSGLLVYEVSVGDGLSRVGGVDHFDPSETGVNCSNWWTRSNSVVQRSIFMSSLEEDFVYSIAREEVLIASLEALEEPVQQVSLLLEDD